MKRKFVVVFESRILYTSEVEAETPSEAEAMVLRKQFRADHPDNRFLTEEWTHIETQDVGAASNEV